MSHPRQLLLPDLVLLRRSVCECRFDLQPSGILTLDEAIYNELSNYTYIFFSYSLDLIMDLRGWFGIW